MKKFKFYGQYDAMQCGIACLRMVCAYYGREYSSDFISKYCHATTEGVSLLGIMEAATKLGFQTVCNRLTLEQLREKNLPCVLHWNQNHFVVLYKIKKQKYYIADPGKGKVVYGRDDFEAKWSQCVDNAAKKGIALFLTPSASFDVIREEMPEQKKHISVLLKYLRPYRILGEFSRKVGTVAGSSWNSISYMRSLA